MKRIILLFSIYFIARLSLLAQYENAAPEDFKAFMKTKTLVVLNQDPFSTYNTTIKACMEKFWTITPYEIVNYSEFEAKKKNPDYSFIVFSEVEKEELNKTYKFYIMNFVLGKDVDDINLMPDMGSTPLGYVDVDEANFLYKIGALLEFMQYYVKYNIDNPGSKIDDIIKVNSPEIEKKELWLVQDELSPEVNTIAKIKKVYPYPVKITTREEIGKAIEEKNEKVAFLHKVGPEDTNRIGKCWKFIISASDGKVLFYSKKAVSDDNPDALLERDLKKLGNK